MKFVASFARATDGLLDAVNEVNPAAVLGRDSLIDAAAVAGDMVTLGLKQVADKPLEGDALRDMKQILAQAENLYFFAHTKLDPNGRPVRRGLSDSFGSDNAKFRKDAIELRAKLTDPSGSFRVPADRFSAK
jgi:hypothetical protein